MKQPTPTLVAALDAPARPPPSRTIRQGIAAIAATNERAPSPGAGTRTGCPAPGTRSMRGEDGPPESALRDLIAGPSRSQGVLSVGDGGVRGVRVIWRSLCDGPLVRPLPAG